LVTTLLIIMTSASRRLLAPPMYLLQKQSLQWFVGRSSLGTCGVRSDGPVGPRSGLWRTVQGIGGCCGSLAELASFLAGAVPGGVSTRWCGASGEDVDWQGRLVRGGRYGSADPEIYLKRTQFKTVHLYFFF
jgi:hypothetical protein